MKFFFLLISLVISQFNALSFEAEDLSKEFQSKNEENYFIENKGQWPSTVLFLAKQDGLNNWITTSGVYFEFYKIKGLEQVKNLKDGHKLPDFHKKGHRIKYEWVKSHKNMNPRGSKKKAGYFNFILSNDTNNHFTNVSLFEEVMLESIYEGIDLRFHFNQGLIRYDFIVHPQADPNQIRFHIKGAKESYLNRNGELTIKTRFGLLENKGLYCFTQDDKIKVNANFEIKNKLWGFNLSPYDKNQILVIDPILYSTFIGGSSTDHGECIVLDDLGNAYITGSTVSADYDTTVGVFQSTQVGNNYNVFVTKLDKDGNTLIYSTLIGGSGSQSGFGIAVDSFGNAFITGAASNLYPTTPNAINTIGSGPISSAFLTKLNSAGTSLIYSTFIGGSQDDKAFSVAIDSGGNAYISGNTNSLDFSVTPGAFQTSPNGVLDGFVTKVNSTGTAIIYSTYLGGSSWDYSTSICIDSLGNAYITGNTISSDFPVTPGALQTGIAGSIDAYVTKLNPSGTALIYSTFLGGINNDRGNAIVVDQNGKAYLTGETFSPNFNITSNAYQTTFEGLIDIFISKIDSTGTSLEFSTFLGGSQQDRANGIALDQSGNVYIAGESASSDYDISLGAFQSTYGGFNNDAVFSKLNSTGDSILYSSFLNGNNANNAASISVNLSSKIGITGSTASTDFPTTNGTYQTMHAGNYDVFAFLYCISNDTVITLSSDSSTYDQTVCLNSSIDTIIYSTVGINGILPPLGLPPGVSASWNSDTLIIHGTPTQTGIFQFSIPLVNSCIDLTGEITVVPQLSVSPANDTPTVCINNQMNVIEHYCTESMNIGVVTGLPFGVTANLFDDTLKISGTPSEFGQFVYSVEIVGLCGTDTAIGIINVLDSAVASVPSSLPAICLNSSLIITHTTYQTTGIGIPVGLPSGVTAVWSMDTITISGIASLSGTFNYSIPLIGNCNLGDSATGTIIVSNVGSASPASINPTICIGNSIPNISHLTYFIAGIGLPNGLPPGVNANWTMSSINISGTPNTTGIYNYSIPLISECGENTAFGTITVNSCASILENNNTFSLRIAPNPSSGIFNVHFENGLFGLVEYTIEDINGKIIVSGEMINEKKLTLNISDYSNGIYFLNFNSEYGQKKYKLIKQ